MALAEINWHPADRQLRQFGCVALVALPLAGWLWSGSLGVTLMAAIVGLAMAGVGAVAPRWLRLPFLGLSLVALPIGLVVGELVLLAVFCLVFVPMGLYFRLVRRDALQRQFAPESQTYWEPKRQPTDVASYFRRW